MEIMYLISFASLMCETSSQCELHINKDTCIDIPLIFSWLSSLSDDHKLFVMGEDPGYGHKG